LEAVVPVVGARWTIARLFAAAKGEVGLDHDEVRSWTGWYQRLTLAMRALALLTILRSGAIAVEQFKKSLPPALEASPLAAFKASGGLSSR
jgi:SRSO17 transposase